MGAATDAAGLPGAGRRRLGTRTVVQLVMRGSSDQTSARQRHRGRCFGARRSVGVSLRVFGGPMNADLAEVTLEDTVRGAVVVARGQLDLDTVSPLRKALDVACQDRVDDVVVDFAGVTFCESRTVALLESASTRLKAS